MIKRNFLELSSQANSLPIDTTGTFHNGINLPNDEHPDVITFHNLESKSFVNNASEDSSMTLGVNARPEEAPSTLFTPSIISVDVPNAGQRSFLEDVTVSGSNINLPSGLITPPDLPDGRHPLPDNVGAFISSKLQGEVQIDGVGETIEPPTIDEENQPPPEFPPQFGVPSSGPCPPPVEVQTCMPAKSPNSLHQDLSTPTLPDEALRTSHHHAAPPTQQFSHSPEKPPPDTGDTPSTISPPASLAVNIAPPADPKCDSSSPNDAPTLPSSPCDDAEYAAAARAAVDSVVCALVGNKPPSTTASYDPSLMGTGTDRLYSLSLAPVSKNELSVNTSSTSTAVPVALPVCSHSLLLTSAAQASEGGLTSLTCPTCGVNVPVKQLIAHQGSTGGEVKHLCDTCGRCFVREDKLKRHIMSIHTMEKPHVCSICTKAFSRK